MVAIALALGVVVLAAGCGGSKPSVAKLSFQETPFNAANFVDPRIGSNQWLPLKPGTQWVRTGTTLIGNRKVPHEVVTTVTDVVREIQGVKAVLVYDNSVGAGQVVGRSLDYFAQDKEGNVWTMGSVTQAFEAGRYVGFEEVWQSGFDGARSGILMPADPKPGSQPWSIARPPHTDGDAAKFERMQVQECVPFKCFDNVLVTQEGKRSALNNEFKYYALGVGQIRNEPLASSRHDDIEKLINITNLSPEGLTEASNMALSIDALAAKENPAAFGSAPATRA